MTTRISRANQVGGKYVAPGLGYIHRVFDTAEGGGLVAVPFMRCDGNNDVILPSPPASAVWVEHEDVTAKARGPVHVSVECGEWFDGLAREAVEQEATDTGLVKGDSVTLFDYPSCWAETRTWDGERWRPNPLLGAIEKQTEEIKALRKELKQAHFAIVKANRLSTSVV